LKRSSSHGKKKDAVLLEMVDLYFSNLNETLENKALQLDAFGIAAEARIDSATMRQEIRDELNLIWESM